MSHPLPTLEPPARTHEQAQALFRRPFAPGAIGFRAMTKVAHGDQPYGGAQVAAYIAAQSVIQRLNTVVPGRWRQDFHPVEAPASSRKLYLTCRLTVTLPVSDGGPDIDAVYEDIGEIDAGSRTGLKALYSDARKRAGAAAGIGTYLYTALEPVVLAIGDGDRHVQAIARGDRDDRLVLSAATEQWLRTGYAQRIASDSVRHDLGEILAHGEPQHGMGQGEAAELTPPTTTPDSSTAAPPQTSTDSNGNGVVNVDFGGLGPQAA